MLLMLMSLTLRLSLCVAVLLVPLSFCWAVIIVAADVAGALRSNGHCG
jgi:hypothetical protein